MTALIRAGWLLSAALFATLLASILHVHFAGAAPFALLAAVAIVVFARPSWGLPLVAALVPIAWYTASQEWNSQVAWAEAIACAALTGLGLDAWRGGARVPRQAAAPAAVLGAIVIASLAASLGVLAMRGGAPFWRGLAATLTRAYFIDHSLFAVHAGLLLLEGIFLFAHAARLGMRPGTFRDVCAGTAAGAAIAALCTLRRLFESAARGDAFWASLIDLSGRLRWNVHYTDFNAAGSFFVLTLLLAAGLAWTSAGARRGMWIAAALLSGVALWLTSSRVALIAAPAAAALALLLPRAIRGKRQALVAAIVGLAGCAALALLALALPQRGIQKSSLLAADVRLGLIETGVRMIRSYPAFGLGLGEFEKRSGEFSSQALLDAFPKAVHENAHNNFVQIAAETGIAGGIAFAWIVLAAILPIAWRAAATRDRLMLLAFAGIAAFVLTMLGGHPLLIPEAAFTFWIVAGSAAGAAIGDRPAQPRPRRSTLLLAAALAAIALTLPLRMRAAARDANFEHAGIGVSAWRLSPDGIHYREATGRAALWVPSGAFKFSVNARAAAPIHVEVVVDGRIADIIVLTPDRWTDIVIPARTVPAESAYRRMDLRTIGDAPSALWLTKDEPLQSR